MERTERKIENEYLTIAEVADELRIGKNTAYSLAKQFRDSGGRAGIPNFKVGRLYRVSRVALLKMSESGLDADGSIS